MGRMYLPELIEVALTASCHPDDHLTKIIYQTCNSKSLAKNGKIWQNMGKILT